MTEKGHKVYVSEYALPSSMFKELWRMPLRVGLKQDNSTTKVEKLYICKGKHEV